MEELQRFMEKEELMKEMQDRRELEECRIDSNFDRLFMSFLDTDKELNSDDIQDDIVKYFDVTRALIRYQAFLKDNYKKIK